MISRLVKYYFVKDGETLDLKNDFNQILEYLGTVSEIGLLDRTAGSVIISYRNSPIKATLSTGKKNKYNDTQSCSQMELTCEKNDLVTLQLLKNVSSRIGYRVFNPKDYYFMAVDPNLVDLGRVKLEPRIAAVFDSQGMTPLFQYQNSNVYFAKSKRDNSIHLVNWHLLDYLIDTKSFEIGKNEFTIQIAPDIGRFIAYYDLGLIQHNFYENFKGFVNQSGFSDRIGCNIFMRPIFYEYDEIRQKFRQIMRTETIRDKLIKGRILENYPKMLLKRMSISKKLLTSKIERRVDFETSDDGKILPRLNINIFLDSK